MAEKICQQHLDIIYASLKERLVSREKVCCFRGLAQDKFSQTEIHELAKRFSKPRQIPQLHPSTRHSLAFDSIGRSFQTELYHYILSV
jgi:phenylacetate 2-hydroxylase